MVSLSQQQQQRLQYLRNLNQQKIDAQQDAMKQASITGEQYRPQKEKPNVKEVLDNGGIKKETSIKRLSDLYTDMYNISHNRPDLMQDTSKVYKQVGYNTMSNQQKEIVDYFLGGNKFNS